MIKKHSTDCFKEIHKRALEVSCRYKKSEIELIEILEEVDRYKVFYKYKCNSLFQYVNQELGLSKEVTSIFINVARKTREIPALKEEIKKGAITISKARRMTSVITPQNQDHWLALAKNTSKRNLEKEVAMASPKTAVREKLDYVHPSREVSDQTKIISLNENKIVRVQLQVGVSEKFMFKLRRVQDLQSQKQRKPVALEEALEEMVELYLNKHDPVKKAERQKLRGKLQGKSEKTKSCPSTISNKPASKLTFNKRKSIPSKTRHRVMLKYKGQCAYKTAEGRRCQERRFLEIHHLKPLSQEGNDKFSNLILCCSGHHKVIHRTQTE